MIIFIMLQAVLLVVPFTGFAFIQAQLTSHLQPMLSPSDLPGICFLFHLWRFGFSCYVKFFLFRLNERDLVELGLLACFNIVLYCFQSLSMVNSLTAAVVGLAV